MSDTEKQDTFWATMSRNQVQSHWPGLKPRYGGGYVEIKAPSKEAAEQLMFEAFGREWAFCYNHFESIHELDRQKLAILGAKLTTLTPEQVRSLFPGMNPKEHYLSAAQSLIQVVDALAEALAAFGERGVPSGELYAMLMDLLSLDSYQSLIKRFKDVGLVIEVNHVLTWVDSLRSTREHTAEAAGGQG